MHIDFGYDPRAFNARDSGNVFQHMYDVCKNTTCEDCQFASGTFIEFEGSLLCCENARVKETIKQRMNNA